MYLRQVYPPSLSPFLIHLNMSLSVYWTTTSHCSPAECGLLCKERPWALCCLCAACCPLVSTVHFLFPSPPSPLLSPSLSLSLSYYYLTSIQWRVECIYGGSVLADSCWHTQGPLRNRPEAVRRSLGSQQPHIHKSEMDVLSGYTIMSDCPMHTHLHISPVHSAWQRGLTSSHALSTGFGGESTHPHIEDRAFMHPLLERTCFYLWCCCILNPFLGQSIFFF